MKISVDEVRHVIALRSARRYLDYAERSLDEGVYPHLYSDNFTMYVLNEISSLDPHEAKACGDGKMVVDAIGKLSLRIYLVHLLRKYPLKYRRTLAHFTKSIPSGPVQVPQRLGVRW